MMMRLPALILLMAVCTTAGSADWASEPPRPDLDAERLARLREGEVLVEDALVEESGGAARVLAFYHAPAERIWKRLADCDYNRRFLAGLKECEVLVSTPTSARTRHVLKQFLLAPRIEFRFETHRQPYRWLVIRLLDGDLRELNGRWRFDPFEGGVLVSHRIQVQPRFPLPRWLVRRTLRRDIGNAVACLRALSDASGSESRHRQDLARCPESVEGTVE